MKIRRYLANDMRQAMKQVRDAQGPDAVILQTRRVGQQVEIVAAVDFDPESFAGASPLESGSKATHDFAAAMRAREAAEQSASESQNQDAMRDELNALRRMLETQLSALAWNDLTRRAPVHTEVLKLISSLGVGRDIAAHLVSQLPANCELTDAWRKALALFAQQVPTHEEQWLQQGGVVAFVGATGVGKTSVIAKLAARWVLHKGPRELALICADNSRIGAHEQMQSMARLLGVQCHSVDGLADVPALLTELTRKRLVLIDTAGLSQRDARVGDEVQALARMGESVQTALVLSASSQAGAIEQTLRCFAALKPAACVLTKLDEATSLGGALSAVVRARLPIAYVCDGQRLAEDMHPARGHQLTARAVQLTKQSGAAADEELLARRFGGIAHGLA